MALKFNIADGLPQTKLLQIKTAVFACLPNNETKDDPDWVDPEDGSVAPEVPVFTNKEWADEIVWRYLKKMYLRGEDKLAAQAASKLADIRSE